MVEKKQNRKLDNDDEQRTNEAKKNNYKSDQAAL